MIRVKVIQPFYERLNAELYVSEARFEELNEKGLVEKIENIDVEETTLYTNNNIIMTTSIKNGKRKVLPKQNLETS